MKKQNIWIVGLTLILLIAISGCANTTGQATTTNTDVSNLHEAVFDIEGMTCASCSIGVQAQLGEVNGVISADVSLKNQQATVQYDADVVDTDTISTASTIYPATLVSDEKL